jgi:hypothetical protein
MAKIYKSVIFLIPMPQVLNRLNIQYLVEVSRGSVRLDIVDRKFGIIRYLQPQL